MEPVWVTVGGDEQLRGAVDADAGLLDQSGGDVVDDGLQLGAVGLELAGCRGQGKGEAADLGIEAKASSPQEIQERLKADIDKWAQVIERAGIAKQ